MSDFDLDAATYGDEEYPARVGEWVASGHPHIHSVAQIRRVYLDKDDGKRVFLADLCLFDLKGNKIGRESSNEPFTIAGKTYRGPRTFEPMCRLDYWYLIAEPVFPIEIQKIYTDDGKIVFGRTAEFRTWGKYKRRAKPKPPPLPARIINPNFDPELDRRARLMAAEKLRDTAREIDDPLAKAALIKKAESLERGTDI